MKAKRKINEKSFVKFGGVIYYALSDLIAILVGAIAGLLTGMIIDGIHEEPMLKTWICVGVGFLSASIFAVIGAVVVWAICSTYNDSNGRLNMWAHGFISILVGGLWNWLWIGNATEFLNNGQNEEHRIPVSEMLLCAFVPFYSIYWYYEHASRADWMKKCYGMDERDLCRPLFIICAIFMPSVASIILQYRINKIHKVHVARQMYADVA